jgi:Leucine-rich repeat (LRR) protein
MSILKKMKFELNDLIITTKYIINTHMSVQILNTKYDINLKYIDLSGKKLSSLSDSIGNLINLQQLYLYDNKLETLPDSIGNLINLQKLDLRHNKLERLPTFILKIKQVLQIDHTSYQINNFNVEAEILIFSYLDKKLENLPTSLREIWIKKGNPDTEHKLPFNCELKYY